MTTIDLIEQAIKERKSLSFGYHGFERTVSPYACGVNNANEIKMLAMQTGGGSTSGVTRKLRFYAVSDMLAPSLDEALFEKPSDPSIEANMKEFMKFYAKVE